MQIQTELCNNKERKVFWFTTECVACVLSIVHPDCGSQSVLQPGCEITLEEDPEYTEPWVVVRTYLSLSNDVDLPPKAQKRTIKYISGVTSYGKQILSGAFPQIFAISTTMDGY